MRKLIIFFILIAVSLAFSRTLLVPEEFTTIQQAFVMAQNGDTVSVNFGRPNGQRTTVSDQRIMGKEITFEVRGDGKEELLRMVREMNNLPNIDGINQRYPPPGWQRQRWVNRPDSCYDIQPCLAMDSFGYPWVVWVGYDSPYPTTYSLAYTKWNGIDWDEKKGVVPGLIPRSRPSISFDNQNQAWSVWANMNPDNSTDISFSRWIDTCWTSEAQVNLPDSTELDFAPRICCGGGQIWVVWFGGPTDVSPYKIYASRWNGTGWEPDIEVSPPDGFHHWFGSIAVDNGKPHVVWCEVPHYSIYYSYYDGAHWTDPLVVNDTTLVLASPRAEPRIAIDWSGNLHVTWTGALVGASHRDIFYSKFDGSQWSPAIKISRDFNFDEWYSDIAAYRPDNIWITWDRQDEGPDEFRVYASHFDGTSWSEEMRLDDDTTSYHEFSPDIRVDDNGNPWVVWSGVTYGFPLYDIYYNRYITAGVEEPVKPNNPEFTGFRVLPNPFAFDLKILYRVSNPTPVSFEIYDNNGRKIKTLVHEYRAKGQYAVFWDGRDSYNKQVSTGIYFCRLRMRNIKEVRKLILLK